MCEKCEDYAKKEKEMILFFHKKINEYIQEKGIDLISLSNVMRSLSTSVDMQLSSAMIIEEAKKLKEAADSAVKTSSPKNPVTEPTVSFTDADFEKLISEI